MNKDELELIMPTKEYKKEVEEYLQEFLDNGENEIAGDGGLDRIKDFDKWLEFYDYSKKHRLTAMYNENNEIIEWYFDIARKIGKDNGMPYEDDLYLDVVVTPTRDIILLDEDELKEALDRFEVNKSDYDMAYNEAKKLIELLEENKDKLKEFTDKYFNKMLKE